MSPLVIEIFEDNVNRDSRTIQGRDGKPDLTLYSQVAFAHFGGRFPVEISLPLSEDETAYAAGKYFLDASCFKVGQYGRLEFQRNMTLIPCSASLAKVS